jgi:hypothetical protein
MSGTRHIGWVMVFVGYLFINVAVIIAAGFMTRPRDESTRDLGPLLSVSDEVLISEKLAETPEVISAKEPLNVVNLPRFQPSPDPGRVAPREYPSRDYPELMAEYTKELKAYLAAYFHITPYSVKEIQR